MEQEGLKLPKTALAQVPAWCLCLKSRGKLEFCAISNFPSPQRESQGDSTCWRSLRYFLEFFPLGKCRNFPVIAGMVLGWRDGHFPLEQVALNLIQPGFDILVFLNFSFPRHALSSACHWLGPSRENQKKLIKDIHVSPTNTVAEKRARTPWNRKGLFPLPRHTLNQGCWGWGEV